MIVSSTNKKKWFMYIQDNKIETVKNYIGSLQKNENSVYIILLAEQDAPELNKLVSELNSLGICFFGGIFPGLINGNQYPKTGIIIQELPFAQKPIVIKNLQDPEKELKTISVPQSGNRLTQLVLVDGICEGVSNFLFEMYNYLGNSVNFLGTGAGSISLESTPCLFSNEGVFKNAAITCLINQNSLLGVRHGWESIDGPFVATKTKENTILEINWEPAFSFYKKIIQKDSGQEIERDNFLEISKSYPFGIYKEGSEFIVRDPIKVNKNNICCIGDVPENTILYLLKSNNESLKKAAGSTFNSSAIQIKQAKSGLVFDCVSRMLFLGDEFQEELSAVTKSFKKLAPEINPEGALALGEIALNGSGNLEFFNKTIVTGILYDSEK